MSELFKAAALEKRAAGDEDLEYINRQTLLDMIMDDVFTFRLSSCDDQVVRDYERFTD